MVYPQQEIADPVSTGGDQQHKAVIFGAGPAGLTAAFELLSRTAIKPVILEKSDFLGGISRTANYKGNRIDIGGHRFFSKSDRVMQWWLDRMPPEERAGSNFTVTYQRSTRTVAAGSQLDPESTDRVMLVRGRKSRIYFLRRFFDYPIALSADTIRKLGLIRMTRIGFSYVMTRLRPIPNEKSLEDFFINRFGRELYRTFFKSYTEKVWGVPCNEISAEWGAQRVKGLSITKTIAHAVRKLFARNNSADIGQKQTETSLIEQFLYPKFGPGQMWEIVGAEVQRMGGSIRHGYLVEKIYHTGDRVTAISARHLDSGKIETLRGEYFFSTMPVQELVRALDPPAPANVREVSDGLVYRDFITVGLLLNDLKIKEDTDKGSRLIRDNWIYIQEPDVTVGRLQIFNNWSPWMVADRSKVWIGLEYFCNTTDPVWSLPDEQMIALAKAELAKIGIIEESAVQDATVLRVEKTYPAYFGTYDRFGEIREFVDRFQNLFLIGRNGMHKYNNQDHSMLTAMLSVKNILGANYDVWGVNVDNEYHEEIKEQEEKDLAILSSTQPLVPKRIA